MNRYLVSIPAFAFGALVIAACGGSNEPAKQPGKPAVSKEEGIASFEVVRQDLQHARCQNCHPQGDAPLQGDLGLVHTQNVQRGPEGKGMPGQECTTCHGPANPPASYGNHIPPGVATGWRMPPPDHKMVFVGVPAAELCEHIRDPKMNGNMDLRKLEEHVEDPLVAWGWTPGKGRTTLPVDRPTFIKAWHSWLDAGMPCPAPTGASTQAKN